jgi:hypothetical protein
MKGQREAVASRRRCNNDALKPEGTSNLVIPGLPGTVGVVAATCPVVVVPLRAAVITVIAIVGPLLPLGAGISKFEDIAVGERVQNSAGLRSGLELDEAVLKVLSSDSVAEEENGHNLVVVLREDLAKGLLVTFEALEIELVNGLRRLRIMPPGGKIGEEVASVQVERLFKRRVDNTLSLLLAGKGNVRKTAGTAVGGAGKADLLDLAEFTS